MICPCQEQHLSNTKNYLQCCMPLHDGETVAKNPEQLMRSRYSAFFLARGQYIFDTHHVEFRGNTTVDEYNESAKATAWCGLEVVNSKVKTTLGTVEFKASYIDDKHVHCLHENSNFILDNGTWYYTDGIYMPRSKIAIKRNDACPCLSGLKAKKCCLLL